MSAHGREPVAPTCTHGVGGARAPGPVRERVPLMAMAAPTFPLTPWPEPAQSQGLGVQLTVHGCTFKNPLLKGFSRPLLESCPGPWFRRLEAYSCLVAFLVVSLPDWEDGRCGHVPKSVCFPPGMEDTVHQNRCLGAWAAAGGLDSLLSSSCAQQPCPGVPRGVCVCRMSRRRKTSLPRSARPSS